ncbi:G2/M phase-specific E3 ubiquitin-protein ligase-like isoform X1 [Dysidea avara]|uniref:G2/M phase-specific E3 ubiquitin-protein ligase-like isoform X1 n=1 Tax=Dysidea avara TaxID=196820 RepID=UPI003328E0E3
MIFYAYQRVGAPSHRYQFQEDTVGIFWLREAYLEDEETYSDEDANLEVETCSKCFELFPIFELPEHLEVCDGIGDSDEDLLIPFPSRRNQGQPGQNEVSETQDVDRRSREVTESRSRGDVERQLRGDEDRISNRGAERRSRGDEERRSTRGAERRSRGDEERVSTRGAERRSRGDAERRSRENEDRRNREDEERRSREDEVRSSRENEVRSSREDEERRSREDEERSREDEERMSREDVVQISSDESDSGPYTSDGNQYQSDNSGIILLSVDEQETDECILLQTCSNSVENTGNPDPQNFNNIQSIIQHLQSSLNDELSIDIRRSNLLKDALKEAKKKKFDPMKSLMVTFVGEAGIDYGGPKREFFRLLIKAFKESDIMYGGMKKFLTGNVPAIQAGHFKAMGCYAGMSIAQGGPGFPILADALFRYMTTGQTTGIKVPSEHLPLQLQSVVAEIEAANTDEQLCDIFKEPENEFLLLETGCHMLTTALKIQDKHSIVSLLIDYHCVIKPKAAIDQFIEGLHCSGVMHYVKHYPEIMEPLFCKPKIPLTAVMLKGMFSTSFSEDSNPLRATEEQSYIYFVDFLDRCEAGEGICKLEEVLIFCTGADCVPPLGFNKKIDLVFLGSQQYLPTASTCLLILRIPTCYQDADLFNEKMEMGLKGGQHNFGVV